MLSAHTALREEHGPPLTGHRYGAPMRALILHGPDDLRLEEVARPDPGDGEIIVAIDAALTCATDAKTLVRGRHPSLGPLPAAFGHEGTGIVAATGPGVRGVAVGDAVVVANSAPCGSCEWCRVGREGLCAGITYLSGTYAEYLRVPAPVAAVNVIRRPAGLAAPLAALAEPVACAVRAAERSSARPGDTVVVLGGGLQGQVVAGVLARRGCEVVLCDPHADRRALALRMGVQRVAEAPRDPTGIARVRGLTPGGLGAHVTVAAVGAVAAWEAAVALTRPGGEANFHGGPAPDQVLALPAAQLHYHEITLQASYHHTPATFRRALAMIDAERDLFGSLLGPEIGLEQVAAALAAGGPKRIVRPGPSGNG
jgi:L-iditol 2-dehydrogenase